MEKTDDRQNWPDNPAARRVSAVGEADGDCRVIARSGLVATAVDAVLDSGDDLTAIALDAGFASHSHFTARFRRFYGCTPTALRRVATAGRIAELRKIVTAHRQRLG